MLVGIFGRKGFPGFLEKLKESLRKEDCSPLPVFSFSNSSAQTFTSIQPGLKSPKFLTTATSQLDSLLFLAVSFSCYRIMHIHCGKLGGNGKL